MITQENLKEVLEILGFEALSGGGGGKKQILKKKKIKKRAKNFRVLSPLWGGGGKKLDSKQAHIYTKTIKSSTDTYIMQVDFANKELIYPQGIKINDTTTSNFSHPENFVVFECVHRLLEKGYKAESLELEPRWQLGREAKSGKADILVHDHKNAPYLIIECKTAGENSKSEFSKEWERMQNNGGQLFSYFQQEKATKFLCLYTSDLEKHDQESKSIKYQNYIIQAFDNDEYLQENELENSYKKASNNTELFAVWKESYKLQSFTQGIFESQVNAYKILELTPTFSNLQELKEEGKYHEFAKILRKHNISGKENAFDKLVNIFLCKIYDESFNKNNLKFGYFGVMADTYASMQDRLMLLYKEAMSEFLGEEITFVSNDDIEKAFKKLHATDLKAQIQKHIKELKFYSNNDFAFLEVHNKELFLQNAIVLKEIIELFAPYKLTQNSTNQFLGNLFELFLQKGMKQDEGQFFTPIQICEFIMYALPLDSMLSSKPLKVLDFACGAGHFLNTYANELKRYATQDLQEHYKQIYGIEKEYRLSKVAKVSSAMYGQNEINILYADALATHELENPKTDKGNKQKPQINNHSFDLLIANPPYSVKGFLETLSAKSKKTYTLFTNEINIETNNAIECFFIERANQLLRDNAKAAIILPSSILNKDGLYKSTREILLINFDFIAIVELGSGTFGATGTNTIILFLRKKDSFTPENTTISQDYSNIKNYIESGHLSQNEPYKDYINAFNAYCDFRGFDKGEYESFLNGSLESYPNGRAAGFRAQNTKIQTQLLELEAFKEYHAAFKETSEYKKLLDSKAYKDSKDKDALAHNAFLAYARAIEKDKLLYFSLSRNQAPIIIKAPNDNKEQKRFLGYEWSNRKGDEGLKELHSPYLSPLFERDNPHNPNKLAHLVRQAFLESTAYGNHTDSATYHTDPSPCHTERSEVSSNTESKLDFSLNAQSEASLENDKQIESNPIPQDLSSYAFKANLIDMLDFSKVDFNKAISLNPLTNRQKIASKFPLVKLQECGDFFMGGTPSRKIASYWNGNIKWLTIGDYKNHQIIMDTQEKITEQGFKESNAKMIPKGAVVVSIYATIGRVGILGEDMTTNQAIVSIVPNDEFNNKYLMYVIDYFKFQLFDEVITTSQKNVNLNILQNMKIPKPDIKIQKQIVAECEKVEEQYNTIRMSIEKYQELIKAILVKCGIVDSSEGGGSRDFIASLLDSIQELESKLDFDTSSLRGEAEAIHKKADSSVDCHDFATQNLAMTKPDLNALSDSIPTPPPQGWDTIKLGEVCEIIRGITYDKTEQTAEKTQNIVLTADNITLNNTFELSKMIYLKQDFIGDKNKILRKNDIFMCFSSGSLKHIGKVAFINKDTEYYAGGFMGILRSRFNAKFVFYTIANDDFKQKLENSATGSNINNLSSKINDLQIPLPPFEAQEKIINTIENIESKMHLLDSSLPQLDSKKSEILQHFLEA
ncbi:restriction endonuclease subunit S [Helicobacter canis]|uniref:Uncharacterized protein n=1 Tax=Helicobacter canis NCTC 12740 TaxID=1357399 RepID=V8CH51_9HELI|nr:restriction endonuclease subunit S [Helicobacter canis]ETD26684.1 hypothetical protein HMPREF2087_01069 [Helicobacter canis NCTC 12740]